MTLMHWWYVALCVLPIVCALQRYAVAYGYEGKSKDAALHSANGVFCLMGAVSMMLFVFSGPAQ